MKGKNSGVEAAGRQRKVFLLEDSPGEAELFQEALRTAWPLEHPNEALPLLIYSHSVDQAMDRLRYDAKASYLPDIILIDADLPGKAAYQFIQSIKEEVDLARIPRILMAWIDEPEKTKDPLDVSAWVLKPGTFKQLVGVVERLCHQWLLSRKV